MAKIQTESMFRRGKAISRAPIIKGMRKFPIDARRRGIATKKTMTVPCMVTSELYTPGPILPVGMKSASSDIQPNPQTGVSGQASCQRIIYASKAPTNA